jgi:hypothetical protein
MARRAGGLKRRQGLGAGLTTRGRAVTRAFHEARRYAPGFVISCGVLPEVSESATDRLHTIVREISERHLDGQRQLSSLQTALRHELGSAKVRERVERQLTELLGSEATAAYLFGLSVGLAIQALPSRFARTRR